MKKKLEKTRDLEKKLLVKSETLRHLDLGFVTGGTGCTDSCTLSCKCTGTTFEQFG